MRAATDRGPDGRSIFRFDTFGDEQAWTDTLQMQHAIKNVSPATALSVGLKVDSDALPTAVIDAHQVDREPLARTLRPEGLPQGPDAALDIWCSLAIDCEKGGALLPAR
jgi:hypothetical protein